MSSDSSNSGSGSYRKEKKESFWKKFKRNFCCFPGNEAESDRQLPPHLDDKLNNVLETWTMKHNVYEVEQHNASEQLRVLLEQYERELEERRRRDEEEVITLFPNEPKSWKKKKKQPQKRHKLADTDDKLPYELKPISSNWKVAISKISALSKAKKTSKIRPGSRSDSSTTDSSGIEELEKASHVSELLMDIMKEAQIDESTIIPDFTVKQLRKMSRRDPAKFEHLIVEYTKECLFLSLPTAEETHSWEKKHARPNMKKVKRRKIKFSNEDAEIRCFCPFCYPRHWNNNECNCENIE